MSLASPQTFRRNETLAVARRMLFHMTVTAGGADATGLALTGDDVMISKNGAAFGNAAGVVTEIANGWYQLEFAEADLNTPGALAVKIVEASQDTCRVVHQVKSEPNQLLATGTAQAGAAQTMTLAAGESATDDIHNDRLARIVAGTGVGQTNLIRDYVGATKVASMAKAWRVAPDATSVYEIYDACTALADDVVTAESVKAGAVGVLELADGAITQAKYAADAQAMLNTPLVTRDKDFAHTGATGAPAISMRDAVDCIITATGTWSGASAQPQICQDPTAAVPVWTNSGTPLTADGSKTIAGPASAVRLNITGGGGGTALAVRFSQRKPAGA